MQVISTGKRKTICFREGKATAILKRKAFYL